MEIYSRRTRYRDNRDEKESIFFTMEQFRLEEREEDGDGVGCTWRGECSEEKSRRAIGDGRGYAGAKAREKVGGARISCDYCTPTINFR